MRSSTYYYFKLFNLTNLSRISFIWILLIFCNSLFAKTVVLGTGSGSISQTSMTGLTAGDTLAIKTGTYAGGANFSNLHDITIINKGGVVTFTGTVNWGGTTMHNIKWTGVGFTGAFYGFVFNASTGIYGQTIHTDSTRFDHLDFENASQAAFDFGDSNYGVTYNGTAASLKMHCMTFSDIKVFNSAFFIITGYNSPTSANNNLCDSIDMHNIIMQDLQGAGQQVRGNITHFEMSYCTITYAGHNTNVGDQGVLYVLGNGSIHHNYMHGGRGYLARINSYSLKPLQDSVLFYNNIILSTTYYGGLDIRCDSTGSGLSWNNSQFLNPIKNVYVVNNTVGNKGNELGFVVPVVLQYQMHNNNILVCKNNLSFAADPNVSGLPNAGILVNYNGGSGRVDSSNNRYFSAATILNYLQDTLATCRPLSSSSLNAAGVAINFLSTDYYNKIRPALPSIGAVEYAVISSSVSANAGPNQTINLPLDSVTLTGLASTAINATVSSYQWSQISGPSIAILRTPNSGTTIAATLKVGVYVFGLKVKNNNNDSSIASVTITVNPAIPNQPPVANAGTDQTITAPSSTINLDGSLSNDPDGSIASFVWSQVSGPNTATISSPNTSKTTITGLIAGVYVFKLTVTDNLGLTSSAQITITVNVATAVNTVVTAAKESYILYPNPAFNLVNLETTNSYIGTVYIQLIDFTGKQIGITKAIKNTARNITTIDVSQLATGTYLMLFNCDKLNSKYLKFVKL